jgi:hypothetical protein
MKTKPVELTDVMGCSALKSIIMQSMIYARGQAMADLHNNMNGLNQEQPTIEEQVEKLMSKKGMQMYILRLARQIQANTVVDTGEDIF